MSSDSISLPIDKIHSQFLEQLSDQHLVVAAATGSGKSTRLPLWAKKNGRVLVIEPRRVACTALAGFVAQLDGTGVGEGVGYAIRFDNRYRQTTDVVFVTPGVALRWFSEDKLATFTTVILDEFHERRWDTDLLLALLKQRAQHRLVLTSATLNANRLAGYLGAEILEAEGRNFPVELSYRAKEPQQMPAIQHIEQRIAEAVKALVAKHAGDVLVFLPGRKEIQQAQVALKDVDAELIPLHASVGEKEQKRALTQSERRRIILATNVAETSLTIPGVTLVVDSGLERRTHQRNGRTVLGLHPISKASAEQRRGRAGRMAPGICVRLWGEHAPLEMATPPEIKREELTELVLAAASAGVRASDLAFADPLPEKSLAIANEKLRQMEALDVHGKITAHGEALFPLPIDTQFAHLITAMPDALTKGAMVDLVAALSLGTRWLRLPKSEQGLLAVQAWLPTGCDALTLVAALRGAVPEEVHVDQPVRKEARRLSLQIREALGLGKIPESIDFDRDAWLAAVIKAQPSLAFVRRIKRRNAMGNGYSEITVGEQSRLLESAEAAIVFDDYSMPGRGTRQTLTIGTCLAPVSFKLLADAELGERTLGRVHYDKGVVSVEQQRVYVERVINQAEISPEGDAARQALANLIMAIRICKGVAEKLTCDLEAWALFVALGEAEQQGLDTQGVSDPEQWLVERLALLGVESAEDMELVDDSDLHFEGIPDWQREKFDEKYPQTLTLGDLRCVVHYKVPGKQVIVEKVGGLRKDDPKRWEFPVWSGWKIRYKKASRVVDIR